METRQGKGITLLIDKNSNYGLTHYKPAINLKPWLRNIYNCYKEMFEKEGYLTIRLCKDEDHYSDIQLTKEDSKNYLKCLTCAAEKVNNYQRYCCKCEYWVDFKKYLENVEIKEWKKNT